MSKNLLWRILNDSLLTNESLDVRSKWKILPSKRLIQRSSQKKIIFFIISARCSSHFSDINLMNPFVHIINLEVKIWNSSPWRFFNFFTRKGQYEDFWNKFENTKIWFFKSEKLFEPSYSSERKLGISEITAFSISYISTSISSTNIYRTGIKYEITKYLLYG